MPTPTVGRIVHYVSYGTPGGEYTSQCRCALVVFNPSGLFFNDCPQDENDKLGGTWHWPEMV